VQGGTVFDTVAIVVSPSALNVQGYTENVQWGQGFPGGTPGAGQDPFPLPVTVTGGTPPYTYDVLSSSVTPSTATSLFSAYLNDSPAASLQVTVSGFTLGTTYTWVGSIKVTDSLGDTSTVSGTFVISAISSGTTTLTAQGTSVFYSNAILGQEIGSVPIPVKVTGGVPPYSYSLTLSNPTGGASKLLVVQDFKVVNNNSSNAGLLFTGGSVAGTFGTTVTTVVTDSTGRTATAVGTATVEVAVPWSS
jgi:hypothetical protein